MELIFTTQGESLMFNDRKLNIGHAVRKQVRVSFISKVCALACFSTPRYDSGYNLTALTLLFRQMEVPL